MKTQRDVHYIYTRLCLGTEMPEKCLQNVTMDILNIVSLYTNLTISIFITHKMNNTRKKMYIYDIYL